MASYKHSNGRLVHRRGGRFRVSTLADIGLAVCSVCGKLYAPDFSDIAGVVDPRIIKDRQTTCPDCRK